MTKHHRTTLAVATLLCCAAVAALAADPSPSAAAGGAATVDGAAHRGRRPRATELARPRPHLRRAALQPARADQRPQRGRARPRLVVRHRDHARPAGEPDRGRRHHVHDRHVERGLGAGCPDRPGAVEVRPRGPRAWGRYLCCDAVNRGWRSGRARCTSARSTAASSRSTRRPREALGSEHHRPQQSPTASPARRAS